MKLLDEIRQQPLHIRKTFMWVMVTLTFSSIGFLWVNATKDKVVALLNFDAQEEQDLDEPKGASPFAFLKESWDSLKAQISAPGTKKETIAPSTSDTPEPIPPQELP